MRVSDVKIYSVQQQPKINFKRLRTAAEEVEYQNLKGDVFKHMDKPSNFIFIMPEPSLPVDPAKNTGVGYLTSEKGKEFVQYIKQNTTANVWEELPPGEIINPEDGKYICYGSSGHSFGPQKINPELLTTPEYGEILKPEEFMEIVKANNMPEKNRYINFENVMDRKSPTDKAHETAWIRFKELPEEHPLKKEFQVFLEAEKKTEYLEKRALVYILDEQYEGKNPSQWKNVDRKLFRPDFDEAARNARKAELLSDPKNKDFIDFYKFKQFLAKKHHQLGKKILNDAGFEYKGDMHIGNDWVDVLTHPKAFMDDLFIGNKNWKLRAYNYNIITDPSSDAAKFFEEKARFFLENYDSLRVDAGWTMAKPYLEKADGSYKKTYDMGSVLFERLEKLAKEIKGEDFDLRKIIYEAEAGPEFAMFDKHGKQIPQFKDRTKVYTSYWMNHDWGHGKAFREKWHFSPDELYLGVSNHDTRNTRQLAEGVDPLNYKNSFEIQSLKKQQIRVLAKELNMDAKELENPAKFMQAKFLQAFRNKNTFMFVLDFFGRKDRFDSQEENTRFNYRNKVVSDYQASHDRAVVEGFGYNEPELLLKKAKMEGFDKRHPDMYKLLEKFVGISKEHNAGDKPLDEKIKQSIQNSSKKTGGTIRSKYVIIGTAIAAAGAGIVYGLIRANKKPVIKNDK